MTLMSKEETLTYIRDVLEIPITELPDFADHSGTWTKKGLLETILPAHLRIQPFQSIVLMSDEMKNRHRPSWDEIKRDMYLQHGGLCYWHNTFMYVLLDALGYNVTMSHSTVSGFGTDNHVVVLAHGLVDPGDVYLVDVGIGYSIPRAINLDFDKESPVYSDSILTYKFKRDSDNKMSLLKTITPSARPKDADHADNVSSGNQEPSWEVLYYFNSAERSRNLDEFFSCFDLCFTDIKQLPFHTSPRAMHWLNGRFIGIVNSKLLEEINLGELEKTAIVQDEHDGGDDGAGLEPLVQAYSKYFPQFPQQMVKAALHNWKTTAQVLGNPTHVTY